MCVCVVILLVLDVRFVDVAAEVTQEEGHTGFVRLPSAAVLALIFMSRRIQLILQYTEYCMHLLLHEARDNPVPSRSLNTNIELNEIKQCNNSVYSNNNLFVFAAYDPT